jgi:hypothetical protein
MTRLAQVSNSPVGQMNPTEGAIGPRHGCQWLRFEAIDFQIDWKLGGARLFAFLNY